MILWPDEKTSANLDSSFNLTNQCFSSLKSPASTNNFLPGYLGIMVTRHVQFCCIFVATKDKLDYFLKKLFHFSTSHTYNHNSSLGRHKNIHDSESFVHVFYYSFYKKVTKSQYMGLGFEFGPVLCVRSLCLSQ